MSFRASLEEVIDKDRSGLLTIPPHWARVRIGDVASIQNGFAFNSKGFQEGAGFPLIRIRDIRKVSTEVGFIGGYDDQYVVQPGDLLVGMDGDFNVAMWMGRQGLLNQRVCRVTPNEAYYDRRFLFYALPGYLAAINAHTSSVTVKHLSSRTVADIPLPLPNSSEQRRIVAKLDELFSELDAGVAALERAQAKLKRYRASVLKAAVEGRLTEEWRRKNPPDETGAELLQRILVERRQLWEQEQLAKFKAKGQRPPNNWQQKYKEPPGPDTSELPELPEGWCWATMDQFAETASGGTPSRMEPSYFGGSIPWVKSGELDDRLVVHCKETITERGLRASSARIFPSGTLCVALYGATVGKLGLLGMDAATNQAVCGIFLPSYISTTYLFHYFRAIRPQLMRRGRGGAQPNISQQIIRATLVAVPPRTEQVVIASEVDRHLSLINQTSRTLTFGIERASRVRQSILKRAFEGRLVPQDPNDEPASLLLERIRVSREAERPKKSRRSTASTERIQNS